MAVTRERPGGAEPAERAVDAATPAQTVEQLSYGLWLERAARGALVLLVVLFAAYVTGVAEPHVPFAQMPHLWQLPVDKYLAHTGLPRGWGWLEHVVRGDIANLIGIGALAGASLPALFVLLRLYARRGERALLAICAAQIAVLLLAASGVIKVGH